MSMLGLVTADLNNLFGASGGQLEYVSQRVDVRTHTTARGPIPYHVMVIRFTDHDVQVAPNDKLIEG